MIKTVAGSSKQMTSTPNETPQLSAENAAKSALEVIENCIKNGQEILKVCRNDGIAKSPALKQITDRIEEDTKAVVQLKEKVASLHESARNGNQDAMKWQFVEMMSETGNISMEKLQMFSDLLCLTETSSVKKKFQESEQELLKIDKNSMPDENARKFTEMLVSRNRKIIDCLDFVYKLLPKVFVAKSGEDQKLLELSTTMNRSKKPRKLYILGENFAQQPLQENQFSFLGNITIEGGSGDLQPSRLASNQQPHYRQLLSGYLEDDEGNLDQVFLKLTEPFGDLMNFTDVGLQNLTAKIEIDGQMSEHPLPVVEIDLLAGQTPTEEAAKVIAIVENNRTGGNQEIEVALVPTSPQEAVHGRIVGLKPVGGRRVLHESMHEPPRRTRYDPNMTEMFEDRFARPARKFKVSEVQPERGSEHLDDISEPNFDDYMNDRFANI